jgi:hypothetical protein
MDTIRMAVRWSLWPAALACMVLIASQPVSGQDDGDGVATEAGLQELTRGPIHEAFAEPVIFDPKPGLIVKKEPPKAIEELPPEQKPEGDLVAFIAGYWGFDEDKDDFFYISGIWRLVPPGKEWVAGYWHKTDDGWQWVSGYWKSIETETPGTPSGEVQYYPQPPTSLENGPNSDAPSADHVWAPGCYVWHSNRFVWRGGYWIIAQADWVWVPAHYIWTPCGYVFVHGGWDRAVRHRGVCFAPCYIDPVVYLRPRFVYCPRLVIDIDLCTDHLFVHTGYRHYCFGDFYADRYVSIGIRPWFSFHYSRGSYCPIYSHYRWTYARVDTRWEVELRERHRLCREHVDRRPARTYVQQQTIINNITVNKNVNVTNVNVNKLALAKPLNQVAKQPVDPKGPQPPMKFQKVTKDDRDALARKANEVRKVSTERLNLESKAARELKNPSVARSNDKTAPGGSKDEAKPLTLKMPKSAVASKNLDQLGKKDAPPPLPTGAIKSDFKGSDKPIVGSGNKSGDKTPIGKAGDKGSDKPVITTEKPPVNTKTGPGSDKPVVDGKKPGDKTPILNKPPTKDGDKPVINNKPPPGNNNPPTGGSKPPTGTNNPPSGGGKPPGAGNPPSGGSKPPTGTNNPPSSGGKPPGAGNPPSGGNKPPTGTNNPPSSGGKPPGAGNPPGGGNKPPATNNPPGGNKPPGAGGGKSTGGNSGNPNKPLSGGGELRGIGGSSSAKSSTPSTGNGNRNNPPSGNSGKNASDRGKKSSGKDR